MPHISFFPYVSFSEVMPADTVTDTPGLYPGLTHPGDRPSYPSCVPSYFCNHSIILEMMGLAESMIGNMSLRHLSNLQNDLD